MKIVFLLCLFLGVSNFGVSSDNLPTAGDQHATETFDVELVDKVNDVNSELIDEPMNKKDHPETGTPRKTKSSSSNNDVAGGSVYVRWGHTVCPDHSTLVYPGVAAGSHYNSGGGGANTLCVPHDPIYDRPVAGVGRLRAALYAVEYDIDRFPLRDDRMSHDVPCVVCEAPSRSAQLMVPGKNVCPSDDWTLEYGGYLMSERTHNVHTKSTFICVDRSMRMVSRTEGNARYRGSIALVESRCVSGGGGLPCSPYRDGYELTCAVCTK